MTTDYSATDQRALALLKRFYGYDTFRPMQSDIIRSISSGRDTVVLMPTGGGKSICYQLPALLADEGVTIVVSPLIALMHDQVEGLVANGIPAAAVNSNQSEADNRTVMERAYEGRLRLLYISPERLMLELDRISTGFKVAMIAIDEAHCISQWGHDFRPEYTQLGRVKDMFPQVPMMALTATADRTTRDDIVKQLKLRDPRVFISSFDRPNISLAVVSGLKKPQKMRRICALIDRYPGDSGIIYCMSRKATETMAEDLRKLGYNAAHYHAMMSPAARTRTQRDFINGDLQIVCATVAFGMGIDKSNVRWVIHNNMPLSIESYYQEIGRAGRDGLPAEALMFFSPSDLVTLQHFVDESGRRELNGEKLRRMRGYVDAQVCRRRVLLSYFNEETGHDCGNCDVCLDPPDRIDGTVMCQMALSAIIRTDGRAGISMLIDILRGSARNDLMEKGYNHLKTYGVGRHIPYRDWNHYITQMLQLGLFDIDYSDNNRFRVTEPGRKVVFGKETVMLARYHGDVSTAKPAPRQPGTQGALHADLLNSLKKLRTEISRREGVPPYIVFSDKTLTDMARKHPVTREEFTTVEGVGERKTERYWREFVNVIRRHFAKGEVVGPGSVRSVIETSLHESATPEQIGRKLSMTEREVYREIASMINEDVFSDFDLVITREQFVDIMDLNRRNTEETFRRECHARYRAGLEDVAIAMAGYMLRRRAGS